MSKAGLAVAKIGILASAALLSGCGSGGVQPITADDFHPHTVAQVGAPGPAPVVISPAAEPTSPPITPSEDPLVKSQPMSVASLPETNRNELTPTALPPESGGAAAAMSTTNPSAHAVADQAGPTTVPAFDPGQYMTLGAVLCTVNGTPIYANKVIRLDANELRHDAQQYDIVSFRQAASTLISREVGRLENEELEVAAAEHSLAAADIQLAQILTSKWASEQFFEAGGSEALARTRAKAMGLDFDEEKEEKHREFLQQLYFFRKIDPQVEIGAQDMQRYYQEKIADFTTQTKAVILLIEANPTNLNGDNNAAIARLKDIKQRAEHGEDFATYARNQNDLPGAAGPDGDGGSHEIEPNSFVLTKVEKQVWTVPVGQISDVIQDQDGYYIFKLISRDEGGTRSFADTTVQEIITKKLRDQQIVIRRDAVLDKLRNEAIINPDPPLLEPAVEIAMQNYSRWSQP
jgi:parvulin-like peptidyl-prolyl isomerase